MVALSFEASDYLYYDRASGINAEFDQHVLCSGCSTIVTENSSIPHAYATAVSNQYSFILQALPSSIQSLGHSMFAHPSIHAATLQEAKTIYDRQNPTWLSQKTPHP